MKGLTLTQPYASATAFLAKGIETRGWRTSYRGEIAIHAAKGFRRDELRFIACCWNWNGALWQSGYRMGRGASLEDVLPFGAVVAVGRIVDCRRTDSFTQAELDTPRRPDAGEHSHLYEWTERQMGDFSLGRYGFVLADVVRLPEPVPCRGALSLWNVPLDVEARVREQLKVAA